MSPDPSATIAQRRAGLIEAEVDGELVALHVENGQCYGFNATATRIWALLAEPRSVDQLCALLAEDYDVDPQSCAAQVMELLQELRKDGLVDLKNG